MSLLQAFGIALAVISTCAAYLVLSFKISDFVAIRTDSADRGMMVFAIMIATPVVTALIFVLTNARVWL